MTVSIPLWALPVIATVLLWVGLVAWPLPPSGGDYSFAPEFAVLVRLVGAVIATLIIWLTWFAFLSTGGAS